MIQTNCDPLIQALADKVCSKERGNLCPVHEPIKGQHTKNSGFYPQLMCEHIHKSFSDQVNLDNSDPGRHNTKYTISCEDGRAVIYKEEASAPILPESDNANAVGNRESSGTIACASRREPIRLHSLFDLENAWIFDSGCGKDLISIARARFYSSMFQIVPKINFNTANGLTSTNKVLPLCFEFLALW